MAALVEKWKASTNRPSERALLALRFVQDQIRYLGIEEGMGAFQPTKPILTFQRRFGDCKDQTFLLHALLQLMDIPSTPILVHSRLGKRLPEALPSPLVFNHLVLQLELDGINYYVDPTFSLQGGSLANTFFPNYNYGLLLSKDSKDLIELPKTALKCPTEIDSFFVLESQNVALFKIKSVFYESKADRLRRRLKWEGLKSLEKESLAMMQEIYGAVTLDSPMKFTDDRENNIIHLIESYLLPIQSKGNKKELELYSFIHKDYLQTQINPERDTPYLLDYPLWVKECIHIDNPFLQWEDFNEDYKIKHESLLYTISKRIEKNRATFQLELKHLLDHIPKDSLRDYWHCINEINRNSLPRMPITFLATSKKNSCDIIGAAIVALCMWPPMYFLPRKKHRSKNLLGFYLKKFQAFYSGISILSLIVISENEYNGIFMALVIVLISSIISGYILLQKNERWILILQLFLILHASVLTYLLLTGEEINLKEQILGLYVVGLYFSTTLILLNQAKLFLLDTEKSA